MSISYTRHNKGSEKYHEVKLCVCVGGGGAREAYLAHELIDLLFEKSKAWWVVYPKGVCSIQLLQQIERILNQHDVCSQFWDTEPISSRVGGKIDRRYLGSDRLNGSFVCFYDI